MNASYLFKHSCFFFFSSRLLAVILSVLLAACGNSGSSNNTPANSAPTAGSVSIIDDNGGDAVVGDNLTGHYIYADADGDVEGSSAYRWLRNGTAISGVTALTYTLVAADSGQSISFEVTPVATAGTTTGAAQTSGAITVIGSASISLSINFGIKQLQFSWTAVTGTTHYKLMENPDGASGFTQVGPDITGTSSNLEIAVHRHNWPNARYLVQACNSSGCIDSNEVNTLGSVLSAIGYIKASNTGENDEFGAALALSDDGSTLAVGAAMENGDDSGSFDSAGAVYVYSNSGGSWSQQAYLKGDNTGQGDLFGTSVALSADGNTLVVGAVGESSIATGVGGDENNNDAFRAGAVYVFSRSGSAWSQQAYIKASNTQGNDYFGKSVALSNDGNTLAVGADWEDADDSGSYIHSGAVYIFSRSGSAWSQQSYLKASNVGAYDLFGSALAISADGNTLAVGAYSEDSDATGVGGNEGNVNAFLNSGAAYVFIRTGSAWAQQAYIKASNTNRDDYFGFSVALSGSGNTLAVGAYLEDSAATGINDTVVGGADNNMFSAGSVYVFSRSGAAWSQQAYVKASNSGVVDYFGRAVALSNDGATLAVGAFQESSEATGIDTDATGSSAAQQDDNATFSGAAYVFTYSGSSWSQQAYVKASNTGSDDQFGGSVALSDDGNTLAVGALWEAGNATGLDGDQLNNDALNAGAAYLY
ncbi:MAG: FG-GAP repeat protein [Gammaproteobacteria bacterium]|nr:FG-GAP repeat protein [Gammaproteobacteria bacterium]